MKNRDATGRVLDGSSVAGVLDEGIAGVEELYVRSMAEFELTFWTGVEQVDTISVGKMVIKVMPPRNSHQKFLL
ncbi:hypothetical protein V6N12_046023 [Hibiscus sabdariffa]|uniref:Uncharacterized protein n=1 Tax=Hibiscus sabdariffa TaxID=183260 RepID=A0ABR2G563_9ROSI